jgi:type I site-specific restriction-modification system R (restriction) subunit
LRRINTTPGGISWLTDRQLQDVQDQIYRQPNRTLLEANEQVQKLFFKAQVDVNEVTGEQDPVVQLIDFAQPENNSLYAINQFRIDTPGCVKSFIIPDIVLFVNGMLRKETVLKILRTSTVFMDTDGGPRIKVVCRYQQYRAACKIIDRLRSGSTAEQRSDAA